MDSNLHFTADIQYIVQEWKCILNSESVVCVLLTISSYNLTNVLMTPEQ